MQRFIDQNFAGSGGINGFDANLVGIVGWIVTDRMTSAALAPGTRKGRCQGNPDGTLDDPVTDATAGSVIAGVHSPHQ